MHRDITKINWDKTYIAKTGDDVRAIAAPLKSLGLHHFTHVKIYADDSISTLTTHPDFTRLYVKNRFYEIALAGRYEQYQPSYFLWNSIQDQTIFKAFTENTGLGNGFVIFKKNASCCEAFHFCARSEDKSIDLFYLNNIDLLEKFIHYYYGKANDLIELAQKKPFIYPEGVRNDNSEFTMVRQFSEKDFKLPDFYINPNLTQRQQQTLTSLSQGFSAKEIAREFNISPRTVEKYVAQLMKKFTVSSTAKLLAKLKKLE